MRDLVENVEDLIYSHTDLMNPQVLDDACAKMLEGIKEDMVMAIKTLPDMVAFGIFPYVYITDRGQMFLNQYDVVTMEELPSWQELQKQKFFKISGEGEFIRSLPEIDEKRAVKILFTVAAVKSKQGKRI